MIKKEIKALTGIRFFAAVWVVIFHFRDELSELLPAFKLLYPFVLLGHYAVPLFFILSGFILSYNYFNGYSLSQHPRFVFLRFARIWPVHATAFLVLFGYILLLKSLGKQVDSANYSGVAVPFELAMVRCWASKSLVWNYPAWSIQSEWFAYLFVFPIAFRIFSKATRPLMLLLIGMALTVIQSLLPLAVFPGRCMEITLLFLAGSAVYRARLLLPDWKGSPVVSVAVCLFVLGVFKSSFSATLLHLSFVLVVFGLSYEAGHLAKFLSNRVVVYGGTISYSLYMTHVIVQKAYGIFVNKFHPESLFTRMGIILVLCATLLLVSSAFYHLIENPCNKRLRKFWGSSPVGTVPQVPGRPKSTISSPSLRP